MATETQIPDFLHSKKVEKEDDVLSSETMEEKVKQLEISSQVAETVNTQLETSVSTNESGTFFQALSIPSKEDIEEKAVDFQETPEKCENGEKNHEESVNKVVREETGSEKVEYEEEVKQSDSSNIEINEKATTILSKNEVRERKENDVTSSQDATFEEGLQKKTHQSEDNEPEVVKIIERIGEDNEETNFQHATKDILKEEVENKTIDPEEDKREQDPDESVTKTVQSYSEIKQEEEGSEVLQTAVETEHLHKSQTESQVEYKEEVKEITNENEIGRKGEDISEEATIGQHVTTLVDFEEGQDPSSITKEILKEETEVKSNDAQEASEQYETGVKEKLEQNTSSGVETKENEEKIDEVAIVSKEENEEKEQEHSMSEEDKSVDAQEKCENEAEQNPQGSVNNIVQPYSKIEQKEDTEETKPSVETDDVITAQTESQVESVGHEVKCEETNQSDDSQKESFDSPTVKEVYEETEVGYKEEVKETKNENEIQPSEPKEILKEEAQEKSIDAQEASEQYENEAKYKIEQDTSSSSVETKENEEKIDEDAIVNDDGQTDKSESPLVKEVCEATGSQKAESELKENEIVSKEGNEENESELKMSEEIESGGDDVISSQNASTEDIREPTLGQHATTLVKEILKEEEEDKTIDAQEASEQYEEIKPSVETKEKEQVNITGNEEDVIEHQEKEQEHIISEEHQGKDDVTCLQDATSIERKEPEFVKPRESIEEVTEEEIKSSDETKDDIKIDDGESELNENEIVSKEENQEKEQELKMSEEVQGGQEDKKEQELEESDNKIEQSGSETQQEEDSEEIKPSVETVQQELLHDVTTDGCITSQTEFQVESEVKSGEDVKDEEKEQEVYDGTSSQDGKCEDVKESTVGQHITAEPKEETMENEENIEEEAKVSDDGQTDTSESPLVKEVSEVTELEKEEDTEQTKPSVEKGQQVCEEAGSEKIEYKEEVKDSDSSNTETMVKEVCEETAESEKGLKLSDSLNIGLNENEIATIVKDEDQGKDVVTCLQDETSIEGKEPELVKPRESIEEDTKEEIKSSGETKDDIKIDEEAIMNDDGESELNKNETVSKEENQEKEQEVKVLEEVQGGGIDAQEDEKEQNPEEKEAEFESNKEKIEEETIVNDDGKTDRSESLLVKEVCEVKGSEKAESELNLNENEIVNKEENQEKDLKMSEEVQGGGDDVTNTEDATCEDIKESTTGQHVTTVAYLEEGQALSSTSIEILKEEAEDKEASEQYEEIKPSVETDEKEQVKITDNEQDVIKGENEEIKPSVETDEKEQVKITDNEQDVIKGVELFDKDEDQEKEQEQDSIILEEDKGKDDVTCLQDATSIDDLSETKYEGEGKEPEFVKLRESIEEDTEEIKSSDETKDDRKIDDGESELNENEIMSKEETQVNEQEVIILEEVKGGGIDTQEDKKEQEPKETESKIVQYFSEIEKEEDTEEIKPSVETKYQVESAEHEVKSGEPIQSDDGQKENVDSEKVKETTNEKEIVSKVEDEEKEQEGYDVTSSQDAKCEDVNESTVGQHVTEVTYLEEEQDLSSTPKEIFKEEAEDISSDSQEASGQYEEIKPSVETYEKEQAKITGNEEDVIKDQEKEQDPIILEEDQGKDDVTHLQDATSIEDLPETKYDCEDKAPEFVKPREYIEEDTEEIKSSAETKDDIKIDKEAIVNDDVESELNENERVSKEENQEKEQEVKVLEEIQGGGIDAQEDKKEQEPEETESKIVPSFSEIGEEEDTDVIKPNVETKSQVESAEHEVISDEPIQSNDGQKENVDSEEVKETTNEREIVNKVEDEEKEQEVYDVTSSQDAKCEDVKEPTVGQHVTIEPKEETIENEEKIEEEDIVNDDGQTDKSESLLVKEVSEVTGSEKSESEMNLNENDIVSKEENQEKENDLKMSEEVQGGRDDVTSSEDVATCEDIKESTIGQHVTTDEIEQEEYTEEMKPSVETDEKEQQEVCEETDLKKIVSEDGIKLPDSSDMKEIETLSKDEYQEKEQNDDAVAASEDDLKINEHEFVESRENMKEEDNEVIRTDVEIEEKVEQEETTKTEEYIEEKAIVNDDDQTDDSNMKEECLTTTTHVDEEKGTDSKEISSEEKTEIGENNSLYEKGDMKEDDTQENQLKSTEECSEISKDVILTKEDAVATSEEDLKVIEHEFVETRESMKEEDNEVIRANVETDAITTDVFTSPQMDSQEETTETEEENKEPIESDDGEKVESEEGVKAIETFKDEDQEKDKVNKSVEGQGDDNVKTSQVAALEEDLQKKNYQEEEGKEPEFVETIESIEEDTKEIKSMENEEKIEEEAIVNDDGQTDKSESPLVKEVCEVTGIEKAESELNEDETVSKEENQENEKDLKMPEEVQDDVTSSQIASSEDIKETLTGQHATTVAYIEPVSEATHVDEEKGTETKEISSEEKTEIGGNNSLYEKDVTEENQLNSTEECSEISKEIEQVPLETQKENETNDLKEQIVEEDSQKMSYPDPLYIDESPEQALESVCDVQTPQVVADSEDSKLKESIMEYPKDLTDEVSSELGLDEASKEIIEDEITKKDENLPHESIEDPNDSTTKEEKCFQDVRIEETEPVKELIDGLDEASKEKSTDLNEATEVEPQEDIVPSGALVTSTEDTPNSENAKEESHILPIEDHESIHVVKIPEVGSKSEDSNLKEDCLTSETEAYAEEEEKETVIETTESKQVAEHSSISSIDSVLIEENRELHGELKFTSESVIEEDEVMETKPKPVQSDIASENIAKHTSEKDLEDEKRDMEEDVTIAPENQIDSTESQNETVNVLTDKVAVETEKEKDNNEDKEPVSEEYTCPTEIDQTLTSNQKEFTDEIEYSKPIPAGNNEVEEVKAESPTELENKQAAESPNLEFEKKEKDDELISEIQTPETTLKMKEVLLEATNDTCETTSESRGYADIHKLEANPTEVSEIASEVAEIVPKGSKVSENLPEKVHESSPIEKNEPETTTAIEEITPEIPVIDVEKHEKALDYTQEAITVDSVTTKEAKLDSINQENRSEKKKEADENIEREIATEKEPVELDAHVTTETLIEEREIDLTNNQRLDKEETGEKGVKTEEENEEDDEEEDNQMNGAPVMVEASKDIEVKAHKKSHNILSGVGSKVKHSIAKVKKAITGKSSSPKQSSPKENDQGRTNET